ncbi:hypothetical protein VaNZ11_002523 [Volvox africanus]|uniref:Cytoplasmic tRNA 2-thiolation protein 2 n=1 Tax=Volvox africanus TaxID=51714 RepID=A0ABQ5RSG4_9CHLO|nr:hypothetical protein VaNZ11_002523 [Volvox africanus]
MDCGMDEDDQELLDAGPTAAPTLCMNRKPCAEATCSQNGGGKSSSACTSGRNCKAPASSCALGNSDAQSLACMKCKAARAVVLVRQREPLCQACLEAGVSGKVRALKSNKLLLPNDCAAVAFSGGFSSQTLLCNLLGMRKTATTPRKERGKIEFNLVVLHINEATAHGLSVDAADAHGRAVQAAAQRCGAGGPSTAVLVVPLSDVFLFWEELLDRRQNALQLPGDAVDSGAFRRAGSDVAGQCDEKAVFEEMEAGQRESAGVGTVGKTGKDEQDKQAREARLHELLQSVPDPTGREDLLRHLRNRLLAAVAAQLGANKVLRGDTATALAARVISETAKGRGYALPGEIQLLDAREVQWGQPAVLQPMREVTRKEAVFFCRLRGLQPVQLPYTEASSRRSINALATSFVDGLQANLPSTLFTILRTAAALKSFPFNALEAVTRPNETPAPKDTGPAVEFGTRNGCGQGVDQAGTGPAFPTTCMLCRAPLTSREQEVIAAAAALVAVRSLRIRSDPREENGVDASAAAELLRPDGELVVGGQSNRSSTAARVATSAEAEQREPMSATPEEKGEEEAHGDDLTVPFCSSCRSQILFTPEQSASTAGISTALGSARVSREQGCSGNAVWSKTSPLLPTCFRL